MFLNPPVWNITIMVITSLGLIFGVLIWLVSKEVFLDRFVKFDAEFIDKIENFGILLSIGLCAVELWFATGFHPGV